MALSKDLLEVSILTPDGTLFQGNARRVALPGEQGVFEVLPRHKSLMSRLFQGVILIDDRSIPIQRGMVRVALDAVRAIVEVA